MIYILHDKHSMKRENAAKKTKTNLFFSKQNTENIIKNLNFVAW